MRNEYKLVKDLMHVFELARISPDKAMRTILDLLYPQTISADEFKRMMGE